MLGRADASPAAGKEGPAAPGMDATRWRRGSHMQRSRWLLAASAAATVMLAPAPASADVYSVFSCRDPLGPGDDAVGWVGTSLARGR